MWVFSFARSRSDISYLCTPLRAEAGFSYSITFQAQIQQKNYKWKNRIL